MGKKPSSKENAKPKGKRVRVVMKPVDKANLRRNLMTTFRTCGATDAQALRALTHGSLPMEVWIQRWICHHTDYPSAGLTEDNYRKGCFAWMYYKAVVEVVEKLDITDAVRKRHNELLRNKVRELDNDQSVD